jgi:drug/metabolite transporter (DMT)-like permease
MRYKLIRKLLKRLSVKESWVIFFILGIIMMNYPFIHIFHKPRVLVSGMPVLFLYLYIGWLISIIVIYVFIKAIDLHGDNGNEEHH